MKQFLPFLLLFGLLVVLASAADYSAPNPGPSKNLRAWSLLQTSAKQDTLSATSSVTGGNATLNGYLSLSGQTNRIGDDGSQITFNGAAVWGGDTVWTNDNAIVTPVPPTAEIHIQGPDNLSRIEINATNANNDIWLGVTHDSSLIGVESQTDSNLFGFIDIETYWVETNLFAQIDSEDDNNVFFRLDPNGVHSSTRYILNAANTTTNNLLDVQHGGTNKFTVSSSGLASATSGFASTDTTAAVSIAATGWTNTMGRNAVVYYDGVAITAKVYNNAGTAIYTNATALGGGSILLQPSGKVILSGTSVVGRAAPF